MFLCFFRLLLIYTMVLLTILDVVTLKTYLRIGARNPVYEVYSQTTLTWSFDVKFEKINEIYKVKH